MQYLQALAAQAAERKESTISPEILMWLFQYMNSGNLSKEQSFQRYWSEVDGYHPDGEFRDIQP